MKAIMRRAFLERTGMESVSCRFLQQPKNNLKISLDMIGPMVIPSSSLSESPPRMMRKGQVASYF
jgi:hypothetical protein